MKEPLPRNGLQDIFTGAELRAETNSSEFRYAYLGGDAAKGESKAGPRWRSQFFLESWLGFWTSRDCYRERRDEFCAPNEEQREEIITEIGQSTPVDHKRWTNEFLSRLRQVRDGLRKAGLQPSDYLHTRKHDDLDENHSREDATRRLENHRARAKNRVFEERYTLGYDFPPLPRFRGAEAVDGGSFQDFVHGLCETILNGLAKQKCTNRIIRVFREQFQLVPIEIDGMTFGEELHEAIQQYWSRIGPAVKAFY